MNWKVPGSNKKGVMNVLMVPFRWNCPEKSTNSLKVLPEVVVPPKKTVEWNDWAGVPGFCGKWAAQDSELKTAGSPVTNSATYTTNASGSYLWGARKLYIEHEWIISGESLPFLHYSLKVRHIIQSLWILHFNNFSYRRFISPTNRSRNLLHHRADKWTEIRTLIFWLAAYIHCMKRPERLSWRSVVSDKRKFKILVIGFSKILL